LKFKIFESLNQIIPPDDGPGAADCLQWLTLVREEYEEIYRIAGYSDRAGKEKAVEIYRNARCFDRAGEEEAVEDIT
jgi:hypothetical protein